MEDKGCGLEDEAIDSRWCKGRTNIREDPKPLLCPMVSLSALLLLRFDGVCGTGLPGINALRVGPRWLPSPLYPSEDEVDEDEDEVVDTIERAFRGRSPSDRDPPAELARDLWLILECDEAPPTPEDDACLDVVDD